MLLLVGDTTEESEFLTEVKRKIKAYGLENVVRLLGRRDDVNKIMQAADVLVMPSFLKALPLLVLRHKHRIYHCFYLIQ